MGILLSKELFCNFMTCLDFFFKSEIKDENFSNNILNTSYPFSSFLETKKIKNKMMEVNPNKPLICTYGTILFCISSYENP